MSAVVQFPANPYTHKYDKRRMLIDGTNTITRSINSGIENVARIEETSEILDAIALGCLYPGLEIIGGLFMLGSALHKTIPEAHKEYNLSCEEKTRAIAKKRLEPTPESEIGLKLAEERLDLSKLGLAYQYLYGAGGAGLISAGTVGLLSPHSAESLRFHALVSQPATLYAGAALGGVYVLRGSLVIGRSIYHLRYLDQFEKDFQSSLRGSGNPKQGLEQAVNRTMKLIERIGIGSPALARRAGTNLPVPDSSLKGRVKFLQAVDKGIHAKKLYHKINICYGSLMILGGLASIAAAIFTFGAAPFAILIAAAIFFALMELSHAMFEVKPIFNKLQSALYTPSQVIQNLGRLLEGV
jgi:hypothetical protein